MDLKIVKDFLAILNHKDFRAKLQEAGGYDLEPITYLEIGGNKMQDPYGRTINYLRLSITDRCNLRCLYCMPEEGIEKQAHDRILSNEDCIELVEMFADLGVEKIRLTGGEPLVRKGLSGLIKGIKAVEGIKEVSLTTNGILLEDQLESLVDAGIKRLNISLDTLNPQTYKDLSRGETCLRFLGASKEPLTWALLL